MNIRSNANRIKTFLNRHSAKEPGFFVEVNPSTQNPLEAAELLRFRCAFLKAPLGKLPPVQHTRTKEGERKILVWLKTIHGGLGLIELPTSALQWAKEFVEAVNSPPETCH